MKATQHQGDQCRIAVIGTGYVGLVTGTCLASWGHVVTCVDQDERKITGLNLGEMPIHEEGLDDLVARGVSTGNLSFSTQLSESVRQAAVVFIAVGTPMAEDGDADLGFVYAAARQVAEHLTDGAVLVVKSTVPVGTGDVVERIVRNARPNLLFAVVSNPEFLREGSAINDFLLPDRVLIGTDDLEAREVMLQLYSPIEGEAPIVLTGRRTAELTKYAANSFLATKITFINEMADLCEQVGADVTDLALGMGLDHRIGQAFLNPGPGYGGSCFPKDTHALLRAAQNVGVHLRLVEDSIAANNARKRKMVLRVQDAAGGSLDGLTVGVLGLAFKANTDDMRDSPAVPLVHSMQRAGATIRAYDPIAMPKASRVLSDVIFCEDAYDCAMGADVMLIVTEWDEFRRLDLLRLREAMTGDALVDLRNIVSPRAAAEAKLRLFDIGRPVRNDLVRTAPSRRDVAQNPTNTVVALVYEGLSS